MPRKTHKNKKYSAELKMQAVQSYRADGGDGNLSFQEAYHHKVGKMGF